MFCTNCGKEIPNESSFCKYCGSKIQKNKTQFSSNKNVNVPIEKVYDMGGAHDVFKEYDGLGENNCIFYATYEKTITPAGVATAFLLAGALNAIGASVIGVAAMGMGNNPYPGYLINKSENGIGLIPLEPDGFSTQYPINKMKIVPNAYIFIDKKSIKSIKVKDNPLCLDPLIRFVTIETVDGTKINFRVGIKNKYLTYQESNFINFMSEYGANKKDTTKDSIDVRDDIYNKNKWKNVARIILYIFLIGLLGFIIWCTVLAFSLIGKDNSANSTNNSSKENTRTVNVTMYK